MSFGCAGKDKVRILSSCELSSNGDVTEGCSLVRFRHKNNLVIGLGNKNTQKKDLGLWYNKLNYVTFVT